MSDKEIKSYQKRRGRPTNINETTVIEALRKSSGLVAPAAKILGCTERTIYNYIAENDQVRTEMGYIVERMLDLAEAGLFRALQRGEPWAVKFFLSRKGSARGYSFDFTKQAAKSLIVNIDQTQLEILNASLDATSDEESDS